MTYCPNFSVLPAPVPVGPPADAAPTPSQRQQAEHLRSIFGGTYWPLVVCTPADDLIQYLPEILALPPGAAALAILPWEGPSPTPGRPGRWCVLAVGMNKLLWSGLAVAELFGLGPDAADTLLAGNSRVLVSTWVTDPQERERVGDDGMRLLTRTLNLAGVEVRHGEQR